MGITALTGVLFVICRSWLLIDHHSLKFLMGLHQGDYLFMPHGLYVPLLAIGMFTMLISGFRMSYLNVLLHKFIRYVSDRDGSRSTPPPDPEEEREISEEDRLLDPKHQQEPE